MSYPILPMALVTFLAGASGESGTRATAGKEKRGMGHVTVLAHHDKTITHKTFAPEANNGDHYAEILREAVNLYSQGEVDTMTLTFKTDGDDPIDVGIILEGGNKPTFFEWTYAPKFDIRLTSDNIKESLSKAVAVETLQGLLDRDAKKRQVKIPFINEGYAAGSGSR